jgi:hypothetical protein
MIVKKRKKNKVRDLRTINLIEVNFNYNNKVLAWKLLRCIEENGLLPKEQYSSRHGHKAISQAVNKKLLYNASHLEQKPLALYSNDAKLCYDRIIHSVASLVMQRMGMLLPPIKSIFSTIQKISYIIKTAFRISNSSINRHNLDKPF